MASRNDLLEIGAIILSFPAGYNLGRLVNYGFQGDPEEEKKLGPLLNMSKMALLTGVLASFAWGSSAIVNPTAAIVFTTTLLISTYPAVDHNATLLDDFFLSISPQKPSAAQQQPQAKTQ